MSRAARGTARSKGTRAKASAKASGSKAVRTRSHRKGANKRWVRSVTTVSTAPPEGLFNKDARTIARVMATKRVSPKGLGSAIRMVQYFINRGGKGLSPTRRRELERAKGILQEKKERSERR
jgi:hypothetical protein